MEKYTVEQLKQELWRREAEGEKLVYLESYESNALVALEGALMKIDRWVISAGSEEAFKLRLLLDMLEEGRQVKCQ